MWERFADGLIETYILAKLVVMTDTSLRSSSVFVSSAVIHFTRSDVINQLPKKKKKINLYIMSK